tara:strand:- start:26 stop:268 length:243 start_codon:yes stop_codon:yes gene_type:complete
MKVELSKNMLIALQIALDELDNSGDWEQYLGEVDIDDLQDGIDQFNKILDKHSGEGEVEVEEEEDEYGSIKRLKGWDLKE